MTASSSIRTRSRPSSTATSTTRGPIPHGRKVQSKTATASSAGGIRRERTSANAPTAKCTSSRRSFQAPGERQPLLLQNPHWAPIRISSDPRGKVGVKRELNILHDMLQHNLTPDHFLPLISNDYSRIDKKTIEPSTRAKTRCTSESRLLSKRSGRIAAR